MTLPVIVRPQAAADVREVFEELETVRHGLGGKFLGRLREVFERLEMFPLMYGEIREDVRAARLKQFCYVIYYIPFPDRVEIIAILHGSRDAAAWQSRV